MGTFIELYQVTKQLYDHVQQSLPKAEGDERDQYIEEVESLLEKRKVLLNKVKGPSNDEEKQLGNEMLKMNEAINQKFLHIQTQIRMDINKLKQKKQTGQKYENPYEGGTVDGVFFDSKK